MTCPQENLVWDILSMDGKRASHDPEARGESRQGMIQRQEARVKSISSKEEGKRDRGRREITRLLYLGKINIPNGERESDQSWGK